MSDIDLFLKHCLVVDETEGGDWRVWLNFDITETGEIGEYGLFCPLPGGFEEFEADEECPAFRVLDNDKVAKTKEEAETVLKEVKKSIRKTLRRLRKQSGHRINGKGK